jgi:hypothetical protein
MATMEGQVDELVERMLEEIDEQITKIDNSKVMKAAAKLIEKKNILMSTRRALMGGNKMTGGSSPRITQADVVEELKKIPGQAPGSLAEALHTTEAVIRGHLNRGKDERFIKKDNVWYLRDPEVGVNSADDIEGEE